MANTKMLRPNTRIDAFYPEAFADLATPKVAELNSTTLGFNITCAVLDDYTLNLTDSETDDSMSVCDVGNVETPTFFNYEAEINGFRQDRSGTFTGSVYETFWELFKTVDLPYVLVKRVGKKADQPYAIGDIISLYAFKTDYPVDIMGDGDMLQFGARFKAIGKVNTQYKVVS